MKLKLLLLTVIALGTQHPSTAQTPTEPSKTFTAIANPGEEACRSIRLNWHTLPADGESYCTYTLRTDTDWSEAKTKRAKQEYCNAFSGRFSRRANGEDYYEQAKFNRNTLELKGLKPDTEYMYRLGTGNPKQAAAGNDAETRYFKTAPRTGEWTAAIISDFHAYSPLPGRVESAMQMLKTLEQQNGNQAFDLILHTGDITAWGGSYPFWRELYEEDFFKRYVWAGVNGNHDNMDRRSQHLSNEYFHYTNNNPLNGYAGEEGVCYFFKYADVLFITLNNENMRTDEQLRKAQAWVREVIRKNPARGVVVMEHYQWFYAMDGKASQIERWGELFDECGVTLALAGNHHIYCHTCPIYQGKPATDGRGTVYVQTPSSDNERGQALKEWKLNKDLIKYRWSEGPKTVGGLLMKCKDNRLTLTLYDRHGTRLTECTAELK